MTEKQRTASEIRAYCERLEALFAEASATKDVRVMSGSHMALGALARTDLPRVLGAAGYLRFSLKRILVHLGRNDSEIARAWATNALADTAWLEEDTDGSP